MDYKQSKTPYLSIIAAMALIAGIAHLQPERDAIHVSIESAPHSGHSIEVTGLQGDNNTIFTTKTEQRNEKHSDSFTYSVN
ncbi:MAG: hypothetical protein Roseis2KO_24670 [Roseivirga sp.]